MSEESCKHRKSAADQLRAYRKADHPLDKASKRNLAASYKELAHNEEWAEVEKERSVRRAERINE
jgi:hypothetical protein